MATFPTVIDEVEAQWLTNSLRSSGSLAADSKVTEFDIEPIGMGVGIMGLLYRLSLRYDTEGAGPATSVLKLASADPQARHMAQVFRFYEKEVGFYRKFAELTPIPTTACYAANHDPETDDFVLLFEDVGDAIVHSRCSRSRTLHATTQGSLIRHCSTIPNSPGCRSVRIRPPPKR